MTDIDTTGRELEVSESGREIERIEAMAEIAARRSEAMDKLLYTALKRTLPQDWVDMGGKPYLQETGALRIGAFFGVSYGKPDGPEFVFQADGHYTCMFKNTYVLNFAGLKSEVGSVGIRSSDDEFFTRRYEFAGEGADRKKTEIALPASEVDKQAVIQSALANCNANGVKDLLGLNGLTWDNVKKYTGYTPDTCSKVPFAKSALVIPFAIGTSKGKLISDPEVPVGDLESLKSILEKNVKDPANKFKAQNESLLAALRLEIGKRRPAEEPEKKQVAEPKKGKTDTAPTIALKPVEEVVSMLTEVKSFDELEDLYRTVKPQLPKYAPKARLEIETAYEKRKAEVWTS